MVRQNTNRSGFRFLFLLVGQQLTTTQKRSCLFDSSAGNTTNENGSIRPLPITSLPSPKLRRYLSTLAAASNPKGITMSNPNPWYDPRLTVFIIWGTFILIFICVPCKQSLYKLLHRIGCPCCSHVEEEVDQNENGG